jgi:hypothetical protein
MEIGEKFVLALCEEASIRTTTGGVDFTKEGRRVRRKEKREAGSEFRAVVSITRREYQDTCRQVHRLIVPDNVETWFNGERLEVRTPVATFECVLPTLVSDKEGVVKRTNRRTAVRVYEPRNDEVASLYEMGIPVVETGDRFHVDVDCRSI